VELQLRAFQATFYSSVTPAVLETIKASSATRTHGGAAQLICTRHKIVPHEVLVLSWKQQRSSNIPRRD